MSACRDNFPTSENYASFFWHSDSVSSGTSPTLPFSAHKALRLMHSCCLCTMTFFLMVIMWSWNLQDHGVVTAARSAPWPMDTAALISGMLTLPNSTKPWLLFMTPEVLKVSCYQNQNHGDDCYTFSCYGYSFKCSTSLLCPNNHTFCVLILRKSFSEDWAFLIQISQ